MRSTHVLENAKPSLGSSARGQLLRVRRILGVDHGSVLGVREVGLGSGNGLGVVVRLDKIADRIRVVGGIGGHESFVAAAAPLEAEDIP